MSMNRELARELEALGLTWNDDYPTLEELIEACDTEFYRLHRIDGGHWVADDVNGKYEEIAPTPTEAVARLWRALNGKKRGEGEK